jgi:hypothetical protein
MIKLVILMLKNEVNDIVEEEDSPVSRKELVVVVADKYLY